MVIIDELTLGSKGGLHFEATTAASVTTTRLRKKTGMSKKMNAPESGAFIV